MAKQKRRKRCEKCGFRIRGDNHEEGAHHNNRVKTCKR
jgi:hypothetical protein